MVASVTRSQVLGFRVRAQQLDRDSTTLADVSVLDIGVQDTGPDGAPVGARDPRRRCVRHRRARPGDAVDDPRCATCLPPQGPAVDRRRGRTVLGCRRRQADLRRVEAAEGRRHQQPHRARCGRGGDALRRDQADAQGRGLRSAVRDAGPALPPVVPAVQRDAHLRDAVPVGSTARRARAAGRHLAARAAVLRPGQGRREAVAQARHDPGLPAVAGTGDAEAGRRLPRRARQGRHGPLARRRCRGVRRRRAAMAAGR